MHKEENDIDHSFMFNPKKIDKTKSNQKTQRNVFRLPIVFRLDARNAFFVELENNKLIIENHFVVLLVNNNKYNALFRCAHYILG